MLHRLAASTCLVAGAIAFATPASAHDNDIMPYAAAGRLFTGAIDHDLALPIALHRSVFGGEMENNGMGFFEGDEPGFDNEGLHPYKLPANASIGFTVVPLQTLLGNHRLGYWDGLGDPNFLPAPDALALSIQGPLGDLLSFTNGAGALPGFTIDTTHATGDFHTHLDYFLPDTAPTGVYLFSFRLTSPGLADSNPLLMVLNVGADEEAHEAAVDYVTQRNAAVPEPATVLSGTAGLAALAFSLRRRRNARA